MPTLPNAHALIVGIAGYTNITPLPPSVLNDARDIAAALVDPGICGYPPQNVQLLLDGQATGLTLRAALADLARRSDGDAAVLLYVSAHGGRIATGTHAGEYLLPADAHYDSDAALAASAISGDELTAALRAIPARKVVVILDCCHANGIGQPKDAAAPAFTAGFSDSTYDAIKAGRGRVILAAARSDELSWVLPGAANSLFTAHLLAGLRGGAASDDGLIRIFDLFEYLQPKVTGDQPVQHPIFKAEVEENFPVALYLGGQPGRIPTDAQGFRYDAYISYVDKEPDADWVWSVLTPRLEAAGLRVAVSGDVDEPGVARVVNVERGIRQAKRTIVALSDDYLADYVADFENVLAQTMGIEEGSYRLLPVRIGPLDIAKLPLRLRMLTTLDLTHPYRAEREFSRLVGALQGPLPRR